MRTIGKGKIVWKLARGMAAGALGGVLLAAGCDLSALREAADGLEAVADVLAGDSDDPSLGDLIDSEIVDLLDDL